MIFNHFMLLILETNR